MTRLLLTAALAAALPFAVLAAGGGDDSPPKPTATTTSCKNGLIFDTKSKTCVAPKESSLSDDDLFRAVREFAYGGQYGHALAALDAMSDQNEDRVLTYRGFAHRKAGDIDTGLAFYRSALSVNPDNFLVRSYMGQAFVEMGKMDEARAQLTEIRSRGGRGTWSEFSLRSAIETGVGYSY